MLDKNKPATRWRRSELVWPDNAHATADDWTLIDAGGKRLARIFGMGVEDGVEAGTWRWRVDRPNGGALGGAAETGAEAKAIAEGLQDKGPQGRPYRKQF